MAKLYAVGLGPGPMDLVPPRSIALLKSCDVVFTFAGEKTPINAMTETIIGPDKLERRSPKSRDWGMMAGDPIFATVADEISAHIKEDRNVGWVCAGDPSLFSPLAYLAPELRSRGVPFQIVPAISFINALPLGLNDILAEEAGSILVKHIDTEPELLAHLDLVSTIVLYSVSRHCAEMVHELAMRGFLSTAMMIKVNDDGDSAETADLTKLGYRYRGNVGRTCVVRRNLEHPRFKLGIGTTREAPSAPPAFQDVVVETRTVARVGEVELQATIFQPKVPNSGRRVPVCLMFHGGSWSWGHRSQFYAFGNILAKLGCALVTCDYRVLHTHGTEPREAVSDATAALDWLLGNADELGFDLGKVFVGGGSAGGHIAAWSVLKAAKARDVLPAELVAGLILLNPVTDTSKKGFGSHLIPGDASELDVNLNLRSNMPPSVVFHGMADKTVPFENSCDYKKIAKELGNACRLELYPDRPHAFFNYRNGQNNSDFFSVVRSMIEFMVDLGAVGPEALHGFEAIRGREAIEVLQAPSADPAVMDILKRVESTIKSNAKKVADQIEETKRSVEALRDGPSA